MTSSQPGDVNVPLRVAVASGADQFNRPLVRLELGAGPVSVVLQLDEASVEPVIAEISQKLRAAMERAKLRASGLVVAVDASAVREAAAARRP